MPSPSLPWLNTIATCPQAPLSPCIVYIHSFVDKNWWSVSIRQRNTIGGSKCVCITDINVAKPVVLWSQVTYSYYRDVPV